jgi:hypothetical protein
VHYIYRRPTTKTNDEQTRRSDSMNIRRP